MSAQTEIPALEPLRFAVIVEPYPDDSGRFYASSPDFPRMGFLGDTKDEAFAHAAEYIGEVVARAQTEGRPLRPKAEVRYAEFDA